MILAPLADPVVVAARGQTRGWMRGGWGNYSLSLRATEPVTVVAWTARWTDPDGRPLPGDSWGESPGTAVRAGADWRTDEVGMLPEAVADAAKDRAEMRGTVTLRTATGLRELPYRLEIPTAKLLEPAVRRTGRRVAFELGKSRWAVFPSATKTLAIMDLAYDRMTDLTGGTPYDGRTVVFAESPPHFAWAYAGERVILNETFVGSTVKKWNVGLVSFGWVHELGHDFDTAGDWYLWNGAASEAHANLKAAYVFEKMPDLRIEWHLGSPTYAPKGSEVVVRRASEWTRAFLGTFGDGYLGDSSKGWDDMSSDDVCSLFLRIRDVHGWEPLRHLYRSAERLRKAGVPPPATPEAKVAFVCAALSAKAGVDLTPAFRLWRAPIVRDDVESARTKYGL